MRPVPLLRATPILAVLLGFTFTGSRADEGMWTLDNLPLDQLREHYDFTPDAAWLENVQLASVRFNDGGSGSFVSPHGLVLTNHHVAMGQLQKMSSEKSDYVKRGFIARTSAEELRCPDLELNVLVSTENVTTRVQGAIDPKATAKVQNEQRKAESARIEKESTDKTGLRSDVIQLYEGGEYWLYRYKKYIDVRLVMAAEEQAAFYGGDPDNFTYPRHDLDFAFFRVYENGKPVESKHYFHWSRVGAKVNELVFVSGHPGNTERQLTVKQLEYERDHEEPVWLERIERIDRAYRAYAARGPEQERRAKDRLRSIANEIKRTQGYLDGLRSSELMASKAAAERDLRAKVARDPKLAAAGPAWDRIAAIQRLKLTRLDESSYRATNWSRLAGFARQIVRYTDEVEKPNDQRWEEFRDSALESLRYRLFSPAPIYADLEEHILTAHLQESLDKLGPQDAYVKAALEGRSPADVAHALVSGTKLGDAKVRRELISGGRAAVEASRDPLIVWARKVEPSYRELRTWREDNVQSVEVAEGARIARARFAISGKSLYPDATFTLRLSYGKVAGYELGTTRVPFKTTFAGLYDRAHSFDNAAPFDLSPLEAQRRADVNPDTPLNFVTNNDIIGGNSGSPVLNRDGELVGLIFDSNIQGLAGDFVYTDAVARSVAVHSSGILEAVRKIYRVNTLAEELIGPAAKPAALTARPTP